MTIDQIFKKNPNLAKPINHWGRYQTAPGWARDRILGAEFNYDDAGNWLIAESITSEPASTNQQTEEYSISMLLNDSAVSPFSVDYGHWKVVRPNRIGEILIKDDAMRKKSSGHGPYHTLTLVVGKRYLHDRINCVTHRQTSNLDSLLRQSISDKSLQEIVRQFGQVVRGAITRSKLTPEKMIDQLAARIGILTNVLESSSGTHFKQIPIPVQRVIDYLETHFATPVSRRDLANIAELDERHLTRIFGQAVGMTPFEYLKFKRIHHAKLLLKRQDHSLTLIEIAQQCGFYDKAHLAREFKRIVGTTPVCYRNFR